MPRISLWRENHSNDYKFQDRNILEVFNAGGVGIYVHKYLGPVTNGQSTDITEPTYLNSTEKNLQDLLFMENRDRKYDKDIYTIRGHYTIQDNDFNLSQFGLMMGNDTIYVQFHINDMVNRIGRKIMPGDVLEMPNMRDYWPLDDAVPSSLRKYYVVQEAVRGAEGYAQTWWPHLWRCKCMPMVDSVEYKQILDSAAVDDASSDATIRDTLTAYTRNLQINDAILAQAAVDVPVSGYDTSMLFVLPTDPTTALSTQQVYPNGAPVSTPATNTKAYLGTSDIAPNGLPALQQTYFPDNPAIGDYVLRTDYLPPRMFRFDGYKWNAVQDSVRAPIDGNSAATLYGSFVNNNAQAKINTTTTVVSSQALSQVLKPKADF